MIFPIPISYDIQLHDTYFVIDMMNVTIWGYIIMAAIGFWIVARQRRFQDKWINVAAALTTVAGVFYVSKIVYMISVIMYH